MPEVTQKDKAFFVMAMNKSQIPHYKMTACQTQLSRKSNKSVAIKVHRSLLIGSNKYIREVPVV